MHLFWFLIAVMETSRNKCSKNVEEKGEGRSERKTVKRKKLSETARRITSKSKRILSLTIGNDITANFYSLSTAN